MIIKEIEKYLKILNLEVGASIDDIKKRYKELAKKYHPDICVENKEICEERMKEINQAYQFLLKHYPQYFSYYQNFDYQKFEQEFYNSETQKRAYGEHIYNQVFINLYDFLNWHINNKNDVIANFKYTRNNYKTVSKETININLKPSDIQIDTNILKYGFTNMVFKEKGNIGTQTSGDFILKVIFQENPPSHTHFAKERLLIGNIFYYFDKHLPLVYLYFPEKRINEIVGTFYFLFKQENVLENIIIDDSDAYFKFEEFLIKNKSIILETPIITKFENNLAIMFYMY